MFIGWTVAPPYPSSYNLWIYTNFDRITDPRQPVEIVRLTRLYIYIEVPILGYRIN
jgi:hypothetical protein